MTTKRRPTVREIEGLARKWTRLEHFDQSYEQAFNRGYVRGIDECRRELLAILKPKPRETRRTVVAESKRGKGGRRGGR
jgi:hypothetical protein